MKSMSDEVKSNGWPWDQTMLDQFVSAYKVALKRGSLDFVFNGHTFVTGYAERLSQVIQYIVDQKGN